MNETIENKILQRIRKCGRGSVFFSSDFHAYGSRVSVNKTLERMTEGSKKKAALGSNQGSWSNNESV